ncbi:A24 family peptidase [Paenibacillus kandeliae]|uniref:A24 family peptidase n=1 Tax=Paenibacillus kandeliae TaxID=3231269 RepID=UPI00345A3797
MDHAFQIVFFLLLIICIVTDCKKRMIPDIITLPGILIFMSWHWMRGDLVWWEPIAGIIGLGGISLLLAIISKGKLGGGDIKLFAMIGAYLGWSVGIWAFLFTFPLAALLAWPLLILKRVAPDKLKIPAELPLAPFIGMSTILLIALLQKVAEAHV